MKKLGPIRLSREAVETYIAHTGASPERARLKLPTLAARATPFHGQWRHRSRATGLDILFTVGSDKDGAIVTRCHIRSYHVA